MSAVTVSDNNGGTISIKILRDPIKLRGVPPQGAGFFNAYYAVFRGRGVILDSSNQDNYGLFSAINTFFSATSALYLGCESGSHIEAGVLSPSVSSLEAVCSDPTRQNLPLWGSALTRSLSRVASTKNASRFRIELPTDTEPLRDRDLVVHYVDDLFPPAPTSESVAALKRFLTDVHAGARRLQLGGFYVVIAPASYNGIDLLLSGIVATTSPDKPLTYVGMILYGSEIPLWIFRSEPMSLATLESQRSMAQTRLLRYPPVLQTAVKNMMPEAAQIGTGIEQAFEEVLGSRVTPTDTLSSLFRVARGGYPREVLNRLADFQPKYSATVDRIRAITDLKIVVRIIMQLLYDLALVSQRRCAQLAATA